MNVQSKKLGCKSSINIFSFTCMSEDFRKHNKKRTGEKYFLVDQEQGKYCWQPPRVILLLHK